MTLNRVKLGCGVTFMKYLASVDSLIVIPKTLIWNKATLRLSLADGKLTCKEYVQKNLSIFLFPFDLSLSIVKISGAYN